MPKSRRKWVAKPVLNLPDLEPSKSAVLNSLASPNSRRAYAYAIREFTEWYCSEPRLAFNKTVLAKYRMFLEQANYSASTINLQLMAIRRLAYEAADYGLLSPELAAGIQRVKGVKQLGVRLGNWLTAEQGRSLLTRVDTDKLRGKRDHAMLATLLGCGLRRAELVKLKIEDLEQREEHWVIVNLVGKGGHVRTVPMPQWVKNAIDHWVASAGVVSGPLFRQVNKAGRIWGNGVTPKVVWSVVRKAATRCAIPAIAPHDLLRYAESRIMPNRFEKSAFGVNLGCWSHRSDSA
jgi:site-specific recombinase XerD